MAVSDIERLEKKVDLILDALGLGAARKAPAQIKEEASRSVLLFLEKRAKKYGHVRNADRTKQI